MLSRYRVSRAAIELIKRFEGYRRNAAQLPDGRWTIGHGHTLTAREGAEVSESDAEALLVYDLIAVQHAVNESTYAPLTQNQFDALCSFAFNIGLDNFRRSQVLKRLNAGGAVQAACAMELWRKADFEGERIVIDALVRRRAAEKTLFLTPDDQSWTPAPTPLLRPVIDLDALDLVPLRRPVEVATSFEGDRVTARREDLPPDADEPPPQATPEDEAGAPAIRAAAESVSARLGAVFADPGEEPEPQPEPEPEFVARPDGGGSTEPGPILLDRPPAGLDVTDAELAIPLAPRGARVNGQDRTPTPTIEVEPSDFIPARSRPPPAAKEGPLVWDLLLALLGLAFFGFGVFWGLNAKAGPVGGLVTPIMVAWPAGLAGVGFVAVAVFRLLQRLGRETERD